MKKVAVVVMGNTKGTARQIFQIVCKGWANFVEDDLHTGVNYDDLNRYQWGGDSLLDTRARKVLAWGLRLLEPLSEEIISNFSSSLWFGLAGKNVWRTSDSPSLAPITLQGFNQYQCYN